MIVSCQSTALATDLPLFCKYRPKRGLTPDQEAQCSKDSHRTKDDKKAQELQEPSYPFARSGFLSVDPSSGKQLNMSLRSTDGSEIIFDFAKQKPDLMIKPEQIISWKSANAGSSTDASSAVSVAVAGALFFWPMMLAAPFMIRNYTITGFEVEYIDAYGRDLSMDFATIEVPKPAMELLRFSTGLAAGARRSTEVTRPLYEAGLKRSVLALDRLKMPLTVVNTQKPWCTSLKLSESKESSEYKDMLSHVNTLRSKLGLPLLNDESTFTTDQQWEAYLDARPGLRQWASAYKQQAEVLKKC